MENICERTGKKQYETIKDCKTYINHKPYEGLRHYYCEHCEHYHLTKMKEEEHRAEGNGRTPYLHHYKEFKKYLAQNEQRNKGK